MTAQERIASAALRTLGRVGGVLVTLKPRNISVYAQIDRVNKVPGRVESEVDYQSIAGVTVYILKRNLNDPPKATEYIEESDGTRHTIGEVKDLGQRWQCICSSEPL